MGKTRSLISPFITSGEAPRYCIQEQIPQAIRMTIIQISHDVVNSRRFRPILFRYRIENPLFFNFRETKTNGQTY